MTDNSDILSQPQVISRTVRDDQSWIDHPSDGTPPAVAYETTKLATSPVREIPRSPVKETPVKESGKSEHTSPSEDVSSHSPQSPEKQAVPLGTSPGADSGLDSASPAKHPKSPTSGEVTSDPPVVPTPASGLQDVEPPPSSVTLPTLATPPSAQPSKK